MEVTLSSVDHPDGTNPVPPALEPVNAYFDEHKRRFATSRVILALALREMSSTYGRSPGGYLWAILEPIGMILILSVGFSLLMRTPSLGNSFLVFYASGYLVFSHYKVLEKVVNKAINYSQRLLLFPAVTWLDAVIARFILNFLTSLLNMIIILWGVLYFAGSGTLIDFPPIIVATLLASLLALGIGTFNCMLIGLVPVWANIWKIVTRPLMIASAILYIYEDMPQAAQAIIWWNPLVHLTGLFRTGIYPTYNPQYISELYVLAVALIAFVFGLLFLNAYHSDIVNRE